MLRPNLKFLLRPPGEKSRWEYVFYLMRFRLFSRSRPGSGNALSLAITALETLNAVSDLIPAGPLFGPIVSSVLGLAKTLEVSDVLCCAKIIWEIDVPRCAEIERVEGAVRSTGRTRCGAHETHQETSRHQLRADQ